jgi:hypothetical protein
VCVIRIDLVEFRSVCGGRLDLEGIGDLTASSFSLVKADTRGAKSRMEPALKVLRLDLWQIARLEELALGPLNSRHRSVDDFSLSFLYPGHLSPCGLIERIQIEEPLIACRC